MFIYCAAWLFSFQDYICKSLRAWLRGHCQMFFKLEYDITCAWIAAGQCIVADPTSDLPTRAVILKRNAYALRFLFSWAESRFCKQDRRKNLMNHVCMGRWRRHNVEHDMHGCCAHDAWDVHEEACLLARMRCPWGGTRLNMTWMLCLLTHEMSMRRHASLHA